jgi:hypothetical protein
MKNQNFITLFLCAIICVAPVVAQNCDELKKLIDKTYNFKPSKLTEVEKTAKSAEMDLVWNKVKANQKELLPCLREAMDARTDDGFFRFDASNLLIQLDQSNDAKNRLITSYAAVDLADVNLIYWMPYIAVLGYEGFDTSQAGENWLRHPSAAYYSPRHGALQVTKEMGALFIYGSMDESTATPALVKIAGTENHPGREIAVELLLKQATPESYKALGNLNLKSLSETARRKISDEPKFIAPREGAPKTSREQYLVAFQQLVDGKPQTFLKLATEITDGEKDVVAVMKKEDVPLIRKARRFFAATANPHSGEWYQAFTNILRTIVRKSELSETLKK